MAKRILAFAGAACLAAPLCAQQLTRKFDYKPVSDIQQIEFVLEKIRIRQIVFRPETPASGKQRRSAAESVMTLDNEGEAAMAVGVAIALFDGDGNIVGAGSGGPRAGVISPGERDTAAIRFPFVYRNLARAKTFTLTMEVQPKQPKAEAGAEPTAR